MGTLSDDFGTFVGKLAAAHSPGYQLKLVNSYRLPEARCCLLSHAVAVLGRLDIPCLFV
jgi:hypothetical protein